MVLNIIITIILFVRLRENVNAKVENVFDNTRRVNRIIISSQHINMEKLRLLCVRVFFLTFRMTTFTWIL